MKKRILTLLAAVGMLWSLCVPVLAEEEIPTEGETTLPAETEETTLPTETQPEPTAEATEPGIADPVMGTWLEIDTENRYEGMEKAYEDGYVPSVAHGVMELVLPLLPN